MLLYNKNCKSYFLWFASALVTIQFRSFCYSDDLSGDHNLKNVLQYG